MTLAPVFEFFAIGTIAFWVIISILSITFIACIENDHYTFPTILALVFSLIYWKSFSAFHFDWRAIAVSVLVYVVAGVIWSIFRWFRYVKECADYYKQYPSQSNYSSLQDKIDAGENKSRITAWIAYWPWSLVWNLIGDVCVTIYEQLQGVYQNISNKALKNIPQPEERSRH